MFGKSNYAFTFAKQITHMDMIKNVCGGNKGNYSPLWLIANEIKGIHGLSHILLTNMEGKYL
jgi:hypothetical protein